MKVRTLLILTALVSAILGAIVAYLVLTVPNDLQAGALLKTAREQIAKGENDKARQSLSRIVQQYPRTDAAAAATVALASIADNEQERLSAELEALRQNYAALQKQIAGMTNRVETIEKKPPPAPVIIREPAPQPAKKTTTTKKKSTSKKRK